jgi:hypothetical protein
MERRAKLSPRPWAEAIRAAGFSLILDEEFDVATHTGFLPCTMDGVVTGFEYFADEVTDETRADHGLPEGFDFSVTLTTHSDARELAASMIAAAVLATATAGKLDDPQAGETYEGEAALEWARDQLAEMAKD